MASSVVLSKNVKANHLVQIAPSRNWSRISADCQQKLITSGYDTGKKFLLVVPFHGEQKRENGMRDNLQAWTWFHLYKLSLFHLLVNKLVLYIDYRWPPIFRLR